MRRVELALSWEYEHEDMLFIETVRSECRARSMNLMIVLKDNVKRVIGQLKGEKLSITLLLDMLSEITDHRHPFTKLCYAAKDSGTWVVNDPDHVKLAADKSITHFDLCRAGIEVPFTIIVRNWEPSKRLTSRQKKTLGVPFVIKPALGYAQRGVNINACGSLAEIATARKFERGDNILLQKKVVPARIGKRTAWFRVFFLLGEITPCWWDPGNGIYTHVSMAEMDKYTLYPLLGISSRIADLKKMEWFSTEVAIEAGRSRRRFIAIDYVNDQFDLRAQSRYGAGLPDDVVRRMALALVDKAWARSRGTRYYPHRTVYLSAP